MTAPLLERVRANSLTLGDRPALIAGAHTILWRDLWPMAQGLAARLRAAGGGAGSPVRQPGSGVAPGGLSGLPHCRAALLAS
ncbi:hypothetical protein [Flavonifractor sp. HCP28S3_F3]|uniref:hypothetical protein n=1 Tax=Flavonifractor sp. HCP28S3_F3 TaxID=3438939 RepID=UPI003F8B9585